MVDFNVIKNTVFFVYYTPGLVSYIFIFYLIFFRQGKSSFSGSFYKLFGVTSIFYVTQVSTYYIVFRFGHTPIFFEFLKLWPSDSSFYTAVYTLTYYTAHGIPLFNFAINFNRFTVFLLKEKYQRFWNRCLKPIIAFCVLSPIAACYSIPLNDLYTVFDNSTGITFLPYGLDWGPIRNSAVILIYEIGITAALSLFCNFYIVFQLLLRRRNYQGWQASSQDKKLLIYSVFIFFTEVCSCIQQGLLLLQIKTIDKFIIDTQWIIADISTLGPVVFILASNKKLRDELVFIFTRKQVSPEVTIVITKTRSF